MNYQEMRKLCDLTIRGKNYEITITKETREKLRRAARFTIVGAGAAAAVMGAVILIGSLIAEGTAVPVVVCAAVTAYTVRMVARK